MTPFLSDEKGNLEYSIYFFFVQNNKTILVYISTFYARFLIIAIFSIVSLRSK